MKKENQVTVRLDPITDPLNKTSVVKTYIAKSAKMIFPIHKD
jgi:hypothetical protein